jgi:hypothetical protein
MWAYRHWQRKYLEEARTEGRVRLSSAGFYRDIQHDALVDDMELRVVGSVTNEIHQSGDDLDSLLRRSLARQGIDVLPGGGVSFSNVDFELVDRPCYIFCMSELAATNRFNSIGDRKDAVTFIPDVQELASAFVRALAGQVKARSGFGPVQYAKRTYDFGVEEPLNPDAFTKTERFAPDREVRIALYPTGDIEPHIFAQSAELKYLFKLWSDPLLGKLRSG